MKILARFSLIRSLVPLLFIGLAGGCSSSPFSSSLIHSNTAVLAHKIVQKDASLPHAAVYFVRPKSEHYLGYASNRLDIDVDGEKLLNLGNGEYTLVYLKPRVINITLRNRTQVRGRWEVTEMAQSHQFSFEAGETYFIQTTMIDGEFRGAIFKPESLSLFDAKIATRYLAPAGPARTHPISDL